MISASLMEVGSLPLKALLQCKANCSQLVQGAGLHEFAHHYEDIHNNLLHVHHNDVHNILINNKPCT